MIRRYEIKNDNDNMIADESRESKLLFEFSLTY